MPARLEPWRGRQFRQQVKYRRQGRYRLASIFHTIEKRFETLQFALLELLVRTITGLEITGVHHDETAVPDDHSSLFKLLSRLTGLANQPWVNAVLMHGEPLPKKLVKVTFCARGEPHDAIDVQHALIY